jgi:hypothetical protein
MEKQKQRWSILCRLDGKERQREDSIEEFIQVLVQTAQIHTHIYPF